MGSMGRNLETELETDYGKNMKTAGPYLLWDTIGGSPIKSVDIYLARKRGTDKFFIIKILKNIKDNSLDGINGKNLIHSEYTLLKILENEDGVVQQHGLYKDFSVGDDGQQYNRICLVLDCYFPHDFSPKYRLITNLQDYVVKMKIIPEDETLNIFYRVLLIIQRLHNKDIVHHDIKLGNIILNTVTKEITLANFCLGKQLVHENDLLNDQRGSPAYASPELIEGKPYQGKPSDMWSLGVVLFTMLYGRFPFYADKPMKLFECIKNCDYDIPCSTNVSCSSAQLVQKLLVKDPEARLTCDQVLEEITAYFPYIQDGDDDSKDSDVVDTPSEPQVVPGAVIYPIPEPVSEEVDGVVKLDNIVETANVCIPASSVKAEPSVLSWKNLHRLHKPYMSSNRNAVQTVLRKILVS